MGLTWQNVFAGTLSIAPCVNFALFAGVVRFYQNIGVWKKLLGNIREWWLDKRFFESVECGFSLVLPISVLLSVRVVPCGAKSHSERH